MEWPESGQPPLSGVLLQRVVAFQVFTGAGMDGQGRSVRSRDQVNAAGSDPSSHEWGAELVASGGRPRNACAQFAALAGAGREAPGGSNPSPSASTSLAGAPRLQHQPLKDSPDRPSHVADPRIREPESR